MKKILLYILLLISINIIGQSKYNYFKGQKFISKAEKNISTRKFEKALIYLSKAEQSNYGFCGSGNYSTYKIIESLKVESFLGLKKYDSILNLLNNKDLYFETETKKDDSLKVEILFMKYGKEKVINSFKDEVQFSKSKSPYNDFFIYTFFLKELDYNFNFKKVYNKKIARVANDIYIQSVLKMKSQSPQSHLRQ